MNLKRLDFGIEPVVKVSGALAVLLYVLGLIISNLHLMELGISEFASFNLRNATTGFIFIVWAGLIFLLTAPTALVAIFVIQVVRSKIGALRAIAATLFALVFAILFTVAMIELAGRTMRYIYPWGAPWSFFETPGSVLDFVTLRSTREAWAYVLEGFGYAKVISAATMILAFEVILLARPMGNWLAAETKIGIQRFSESFRDAQVALLVAAPIALVTLMSAFAVHVLPNIRSNIGGHQPQIAELAITGVSSYESGILGFSKSETPPGGDALVIGEVAIWHQSDKHIYVMPLRTNGRELIAIDLSALKTIRYLRKYARIAQGSRIVEVKPVPTG